MSEQMSKGNQLPVRLLYSHRQLTQVTQRLVMCTLYSMSMAFRLLSSGAKLHHLSYNVTKMHF